MNLEMFVGVQDNKTPKTDKMLKMNITDTSIKENIGTVDSNVISNGRFKASGFIGSKRVSGSMSLEPTLLEFATLLQGAGFKGNKSGTTTTFLATETYEKYLTIILNVLAKNFKEQTNSCLVDSLSIALSPESYVKLDADIKGMEHTKGTGKHTVTTPITNEGKRLTCLGVVLKKAGQDISAKIESADIKLNNSLEEKGAINKIHTQEIIQNGQGDISISLNYNQLDATEYLATDRLLTSNGNTSLEITLSEDVDPVEIAKTTSKKLIIEFPVVKYKNNEMGDLSGQGSLSQELGAYPNNEGHPIKFIFHNLPNMD